MKSVEPWKEPKLKANPTGRVLCGYCRGSGVTLKKNGPLYVCADLTACEQRRAALSNDDRNAWDAERKKVLEEHDRKRK